jgi:2-keto-3-deoxy-L-rhamnonate aldolase RhmA
VGVARAQGYGLQISDYLATADQELMVIIQIEHVDAVGNVEEILSVPGIDLAFVGPYDLSGSMGMLGQVGRPEVQAAIERALRACQKARVPAGIFAGSPEAAKRQIARGFQFIGLSVDTLLLASATQAQLRQVRCER